MTYTIYHIGIALTTGIWHRTNSYLFMYFHIFFTPPVKPAFLLLSWSALFWATCSHVDETLVSFFCSMKSYHPNKRIYSFGVLNVSTEPIRLICFTKCDSSSRVYTWETAGEGKQCWNFKIPTKCYSKECWPCFICTFSQDNLFARKVNFLTLFKGVEGDALEFLIICSTLPSHSTCTHLSCRSRGQAGRRLWGFK